MKRQGGLQAGFPYIFKVKGESCERRISRNMSRSINYADRLSSTKDIYASWIRIEQPAQLSPILDVLLHLGLQIFNVVRWRLKLYYKIGTERYKPSFAL